MPWRLKSSRFPLPQSEDPESWRRTNAGELAEHLVALSEEAYDAKEVAQGADLMRQLERLVMLRAVDNRWVRHLTDLDELREGIGLRAFAQQDPLIAYKREASEMYAELIESISRDVVTAIYHAQLVMRPLVPMRQMQTNRGDGGSAQPARRQQTPGRNDPCWCGSGRKYKNCHMRADQGRGEAPVAAGAPAAAAQPVRGKQSVRNKHGRR
jgi:preprotein translocase subunit SecA